MSHEFGVNEQIALDATPEQVWEAIATGPGVGSWPIGRPEIEPREGGVNRFTMMGFTNQSTITTYEPGQHFAHRSEADPENGTLVAFEYLIEGREGGSTVLRFVHSGVLGDDRAKEHDTLRAGDGMYLRKMATYLKHSPAVPRRRQLPVAPRGRLTYRYLLCPRV
ncbi:SRPBCC domain-containing protein [Streptomyces sp. NPDC020096]